jgi:methylase of polypeptide subunit release factors
VLERVVAAAARLLRPGGHLVVEMGGEQHQALAPLLAVARFGDVRPYHDDDGDLRGISAVAGNSPSPV